MAMAKQAASEIQEPTGGEVPREGEVGEGEEEKKELGVVENGGIPGPTMVVQSRTIRSNFKFKSQSIRSQFFKYKSGLQKMNECFPSHVSLHLRCRAYKAFFMRKSPRIRFLDQLSPGAQQRYADEQV